MEVIETRKGENGERSRRSGRNKCKPCDKKRKGCEREASKEGDEVRQAIKKKEIVPVNMFNCFEKFSSNVNKFNCLNCFYTNADSLLNKRPEFLAQVKINSPDIILITEAIPKNSNTLPQDSEFQINGYDLITNLTQCKRGVLIYTSMKLKAAPARFS